MLFSLRSRAVKTAAMTALASALLAASGLAQAQVVVVRENPPPLRYEVVPVPPRPGYVWHHGHWSWNGYRYLWIPGRYVVMYGDGRPWHRWHDDDEGWHHGHDSWRDHDGWDRH